MAGLATGLAVWVAACAPASAEIVFFSQGRSLSVAAHRFEGDAIVLTLRSGGEIACDRGLITRIAPDEVPYPAPEPAIADAAPPAAAGEQQYAGIIERVSAQQGVDARLVKAVIQVESGYQPEARSPKGAMGLMQLMPQTAREYAVRNPFDPGANIEAGIKHLRSLLDRFELPLALAAYNAGQAAVQRFGGIPPYAETRAYVSRVLSLLGSR
jgi:soluble lytic murein transglycosylase-like protein